MKNKLIQFFNHTPRLMGLLWQAHPPMFSLILILNILAGIVPALLVVSTQALINHVALSPNEGLRPSLWLFAAFAGLTLGQELLRIVMGTCQSLYQSLLLNQVNVHLMEKAAKLPYSCFENAEIYDKLQRARQDSTYRPYQIFQQLLDLVNRGVTLISVSGVLLAWKWWLAPVILLLPLTSAIAFVRQGEQEFWMDFSRAQKRRKHFYLLYLLTTDSTVKEIKLFQLGKLLVQRYREYCKLFFDQDKSLLMRRTYLTIFFRVFTLLVISAMQLLAVWEGLLRRIPIGSVIGYLQAVGLARSASSDAMQTVLSLYQHNLYLTQLFEFLDLPEQTKSRPLASTARLDSQRGLEFQNVSFCYPGTQKPVLKDISFTLNRGETLAIVGENGSGKSTLVKLITHLYSPDAGDICFSGRSLEEYDEDEWLGKIGTVFQDFVRYELTVSENIGFGSLDKIEDQTAILDAARNAGATELISQLPQGIDTQLGRWFAEGSQLSGGQWQKIATARAYMRDAQLYILDEPTAALDPKAEAEFFGHFKELVANRMGIFISHRFSTVRHAHRILVLDKGQIAEMGTHQELMALNGLYASLFRLQAAAFLDSKEVV